MIATNARASRTGARAALFVVTLLAACLIPGGQAAVPGANGRIAFETDRDGSVQIAVVNADGRGFRLLTSGPGSAAAPAWSPDGTQIAFVSDGDGGTGLYLLDFASATITELFRSEGYELGSPAWSPDGAKVAFTGRAVSSGDSDVWVVDVNGENATNLTQNPAQDVDPAWSPDGLKIAFASDRADNFDIFTMDAGGANPLNLTLHASEERHPDYAPDGGMILFARTEAGMESALWSMEDDGANPVPVTDGTLPATEPAWSPDGQNVALASERDGNSDIFVIVPGESGETQITFAPAFDQAPSWQRIVASPNSAPNAAATPVEPVECTSPEGAVVELDGSASTDPDSTADVSDIVLYEWWENFGGKEAEVFLGTGMTLEVPFGFGVHEVTLQVTDTTGQTSVDTIDVTVEDTTPPVVHVTLSPSTLWPPNHKLVPVEATVHATDVCSREVDLLLTSVTSSEDDDDKTGDGHTSDDIVGAEEGTFDLAFELRAERKGNGPGRTYTVVYSGTDEALNVGTGSAEVVVAHDRGKSGREVAPQRDARKVRSSGRTRR